jgi:spore photoproduct lyase
MKLEFDAAYYEPKALDLPLGRMLKEKYASLPWIEIESHNKIPEFQAAENRAFTRLKQHLVLGIRKTHKYAENHKVSDYLVPYTSSGCRAMCLYCYLVCNYNKCSYLRLFVNREQMMDKILKTDAEASRPLTFEIGSNSDLVMENEVTGNLPWTIGQFARYGRGKLTFPTKFSMVGPLLTLDHRGKVVFRMSVNPEEIVKRVEIGTSPLSERIQALNAVADAGYPVGMLIAPVILLPEWKTWYGALIDRLADELSERVRASGFIEIIFMTYSYVQNAINQEAFPGGINLMDRALLTGRGSGKYCYRGEPREEATEFLREKLASKLPDMQILYIV